MRTKTVRLRLIEQEEECGCAIACMATLLGRDYADVRRDWHNDFSKEGIVLDDTIHYLGDHGFSIIHKASKGYNHKDDAREELLKPFAPIHLLRVLQKFDADQGHLVVMMDDGTIFCPAGSTDAEIRDSYAITDVVGLYKS